MQSKKIERFCKQCGSLFFVYKSALEKSNTSGNYCCRQCYNEHLKTLTGSKNAHYTRIETRCPNCNKTFLQIPSKIESYKNVFCSASCKHQYQKYYTGGDKNCNWKGGTSRIRGNFDEVKKKYFSKKQFCAVCGTTKGIHIHHIIPYRLTQDNERDNLIPLCRKHHKIIESSTLDFIEKFNETNYKTAKFYLNIMLRQRQFETAYMIKRAYESAH